MDITLALSLSGKRELTGSLLFRYCRSLHLQSLMNSCTQVHPPIDTVGQDEDEILRKVFEAVNSGAQHTLLGTRSATLSGCARANHLFLQFWWSFSSHISKLHGFRIFGVFLSSAWSCWPCRKGINLTVMVITGLPDYQKAEMTVPVAAVEASG